MRAAGFVAGLAVGWLIGLAMADAARRREWQRLAVREGVSFP